MFRSPVIVIALLALSSFSGLAAAFLYFNFETIWQEDGQSRWIADNRESVMTLLLSVFMFFTGLLVGGLVEAALKRMDQRRDLAAREAAQHCKPIVEPLLEKFQAVHDGLAAGGISTEQFHEQIAQLRKSWLRQRESIQEILEPVGIDLEMLGRMANGQQVILHQLQQLNRICDRIKIDGYGGGQSLLKKFSAKAEAT